MTVRTSYQRNKSLFTDFQHVAALAMRRSRVRAVRIFYGIFGVLGVLCGAVLLFIGGASSNYVMAALGLLFGAYFLVRALFYYRYLGFFTSRMMTKQVDTVTYTIDEDTVIIDDALEHCEHPCHVFLGVYESRRLFVLMLTKRQGYFIAKEDLAEGQEEALRQRLKTQFEAPLQYFDV